MMHYSTPFKSSPPHACMAPYVREAGRDSLRESALGQAHEARACTVAAPARPDAVDADAVRRKR